MDLFRSQIKNIHQKKKKKRDAVSQTEPVLHLPAGRTNWARKALTVNTAYPPSSERQRNQKFLNFRE